MQNDGIKNKIIVLRIAHNLMFGISLEILDNTNHWMKGMMNTTRDAIIKIAFKLFSLCFLSAISHPK